MTDLQFQRWKDFALRMARTCYRTSRRPSGKWIEERVVQFFDALDSMDVAAIISWDASTEGWCTSDSVTDMLYEFEPRRLECQTCSGDVKYEPERFGGEGEPGRYRVIGRRDDDPQFSDWGCDCRFGHRSWYVADQCPTWIAKRDALCRCDELETLLTEQWDQQWGGPVRCCIRAGLDCAAAPSAGVVGFSAGDVRRMYPEGVPDWVFKPDEKLYYWLTDVKNGTFAELPDSMGVVL